MEKLDRRTLLTGTAATAVVALGVPLVAQNGTTAAVALTPERFGARGDGASNDTAAFQALGEYLAHNGGTVEFRRSAVYLVGANIAQRSADTARHSYTFLPSRILYIKGARLPVRINGNGATMRAAPGLRYGTFDPQGRATRHKLPWYGKEISAGYYAMVEIEECRAPVEVYDLALDGNVAGIEQGGPWGDAGYQLPGSGVVARNNAAPWRLVRVTSFHHPLDGLMADEAPGAAGSGTSDCDFYENGRQGMSLVGGVRLAFERTRFRRTRRGTRVKSPPGAGVDIEGEGKLVDAPQFTDCEFADNEGGGLTAAEGQARGARFSNCRFIGTTYWSAWLAKPAFVFDGCTFVGAIATVFGSETAAEATRFVRCRFTDDPALSPNGEVYGRADGKPLIDLGQSVNVVFDTCRFEASGRSKLPWSTRRVSYRDCTFRQASPEIAYTRGTFSGTTTIDGQVTITDSVIRGRFVRNGQVIAPGTY